MLKIYLDFKSPPAYLAMKPTLALGERHKLDIEWLPFCTDQRPVPIERPDESKGDTHRRVRALARRETHLKYAAIQNLSMRFPPQPGNTDLAMAAMLYVSEDPLKFIQAAFDSYWVGNLDLNDTSVVTDLLDSSGYGSRGFDAEAWLDALQKNREAAEEAGVIDTPAYLIDDQLFIGREHLPWIESLLVAMD